MTPHISLTLLRTQSDERLAQMTAAGHDRAFEAIVDRYRRPLLRYAKRMLKEEARAEDVVQAAMVSAWAALREGVAVRDLRPWLYRIVHNGALNAMKRPTAEPLAEHADHRAGPDDVIERRDEVRRAFGGIAELPERQRAALLAVAFDGRSAAEVGEDLGLQDTAVRQLVSRARSSLRAAATALTPYPVVAWAASGGAEQGPEMGARIGELIAGAGL
ncbi:MAG: RNA polymerase sigma factor, partial [Solirubrobacteraceae bacterium]|nr:RNA polymerase sigma factor [Solirubrobacteraceae bacterium]